jgi:hypothetical protein
MSFVRSLRGSSQRLRRNGFQKPALFYLFRDNGIPAERTEKAIDRGRYDEAPYFDLRRVLVYSSGSKYGAEEVAARYMAFSGFPGST